MNRRSQKANQKPIEAFSLGHGLLRSYVDIYIYTFYRKVTVRGIHNIPKNTPVILAINHQNALMDALTVLSVLKKQPVFMARSDIFRNPTTAKILRFFKILPIYRIRDGIKSLQNNDAVFNEAVGVLNANKMLCILPEGNHFGQKNLRQLKKGLARIAFMAEEQNNFNLGLKIIPVGIDYSHYINFGSRLLVQFGEPFEVKDFEAEYAENQQKAMNSLMDTLSDRMKPMMLHVDDTEHYHQIHDSAWLFVNHLRKQKKVQKGHVNELKAMQMVSDKIVGLKQTDSDSFNELCNNIEKVNKGLSDLDFRPWVLAKSHYNYGLIALNWMILLAFLPIFLVGLITNAIPFFLPVYLSRKIKDPQFLSSFRFVFSLLTFTLSYVVYLVILLLFIDNNIVAFGILSAIPVSGVLSYYYYRLFKKNQARFRTNMYNLTQNKIWESMQHSYEKIIQTLNSL